MSTKYKDGDIRWKWLEERGFRVLSDHQQYAYMQALWTSPDIVQSVWVNSPAGTGKTVLATMAGAYEVMKGTYDRIMYFRNAVPIREQGYIPGNLSEKEHPYMLPFIEALDNVQPELFKKWSTTNGEEINPHDRAVATTSSYVRGLTFNNSFIIIDEAQSWDLGELQAVYTRCSDSCKIVTTGSTLQNDNKRQKKFKGLTPFEVYMKHYRGQKAAFIKLETNYRGSFSLHADKINDTINKLLVDGL